MVRQKYNISQDTQIKICNEYIVEKMSAKQISDKFNITLYKVNDILKLNNITKRNTRDAKLKYTINLGFFEKIDTKEKAYILGFLYADGTLNRKEISIELQCGDKYILEKFNNIMGHTRPLYERKKRKETWQNSNILIINSDKMVNDLVNVGMTFDKTFNLNYPYFIDQKLQRHFIRGMFDGDGCITVKDETDAAFDIIGTPELCDGIQKILSSSGINMEIEVLTRYSEKVRLSKIRTHKLETVNQLFKYLYEDSDELYLTRKYNKFSKLNYSLIECRNELFINIEKLAGEGYRVFEIAEKLNCSRGYVYRAKNKKNIKIIVPIKYQEYYDEIYKLNDGGISKSQISKMLNIPKFNIENIILRRTRVDNRYQVGPKQLKHQPYFEKIRSLKLDGKTPYEMADELSLSINVIYKLLKSGWFN